MTYESTLQSKCVAYVRNEIKPRYGTFCSIPNEGKREPRFAQRMVAQGLLAGMPDLMLLFKQTVTFFELKEGKGKLSPKQTLVIGNLRSEGYTVHEIRNFEEFKKIVNCIYEK